MKLVSIEGIADTVPSPPSSSRRNSMPKLRGVVGWVWPQQGQREEWPEGVREQSAFCVSQEPEVPFSCAAWVDRRGVGGSVNGRGYPAGGARPVAIAPGGVKIGPLNEVS